MHLKPLAIAALIAVCAPAFAVKVNITGYQPASTDVKVTIDRTIPIDSVILIEDGEVYTHSTAALRIARKLSGVWSLCYAAIVIPKALRDFFYRQFARYRYRLFGRKDQCMVPSPEIRQRFL